MARKDDTHDEGTDDGNVAGVVQDLEEAARQAREEADERGVTPAAVMRSTPEAAVTGDGVVMDPEGPDAEEQAEAKKGARKGAKKGS